MYSKRLRTYKKIGYKVTSGLDLTKQSANAIFDSGNYTDIFEQDLVESEKSVIVSSPELIESKVRRFIYLMKSRQEAGVRITVITLDPKQILYGSTDFWDNLMRIRSADVAAELLELTMTDK